MIGNNKWMVGLSIKEYINQEKVKKINKNKKGKKIIIDITSNKNKL